MVDNNQNKKSNMDTDKQIKKIKESIVIEIGSDGDITGWCEKLKKLGYQCPLNRNDCSKCHCG